MNTIYKILFLIGLVVYFTGCALQDRKEYCAEYEGADEICFEGE